MSNLKPLSEIKVNSWMEMVGKMLVLFDNKIDFEFRFTLTFLRNWAVNIALEISKLWIFPHCLIKNTSSSLVLGLKIGNQNESNFETNTVASKFPRKLPVVQPML